MLWLSVFLSCSPTNNLISFYEDLQEDALLFGYEEGNWSEDYGDGAAFGPTYYINNGLHSDNTDHIRIAAEAANYNLSVVEQAFEDNEWMLANMEEVFMTTQGLIEYNGMVPDETSAQSLEALIGKLDTMLQLSGDYIEISVGEFASNLYGPTSITTGFALIHLQYAKYIDVDSQSLSRAIEIVETIDEVAFHEDHYRFGRDVEKQYLYPNATMLITLNRLYMLTGDDQYLNRAEVVFQGIQPLYNDNMQLYFSPYSQESQGAQTDEYSTLSSQNYLMLGLMLMYENTGDQKYMDATLHLLRQIKDLLYDEAEGKVVHHWIDGRPANQSDKSFFCSGCNLQLLYILWYLKDSLKIDLTEEW
ncbi:MAG: glycoside hydrolase family 76 protein [Myxococcota bacterium]|nr:glycoside hydrolase family 76 protein [Myxococcota bacterium]